MKKKEPFSPLTTRSKTTFLLFHWITRAGFALSIINNATIGVCCSCLSIPMETITDTAPSTAVSRAISWREWTLRKPLGKSDHISVFIGTIYVGIIGLDDLSFCVGFGFSLVLIAILTVIQRLTLALIAVDSVFV